MERRASDQNRARTRPVCTTGVGPQRQRGLGNILGEVDGFFSRGSSTTCGSGASWRGARAAAAREAPGVRGLGQRRWPGRSWGHAVDADVVVAWLREVPVDPADPRLLRQRPERRSSRPRSRATPRSRTGSTTRWPRSTGARVVVDWSKIPADAGALRLLPSVDASSRATRARPARGGLPWSRAKEQRDPRAPATMRTHGPLDFGRELVDVEPRGRGARREVGPDRFLRSPFEDPDPRRTCAPDRFRPFASGGAGQVLLPAAASRTRAKPPSRARAEDIPTDQGADAVVPGWWRTRGRGRGRRWRHPPPAP